MLEGQTENQTGCMQKMRYEIMWGQILQYGNGFKSHSKRNENVLNIFKLRVGG